MIVIAVVLAFVRLSQCNTNMIVSICVASFQEDKGKISHCQYVGTFIE
jgi:hypothetical protein